MRYLLIVLGLLVLLFGIWVVRFGNPMASPPGEFYVQLGTIVLAVGLATFDIVEAIKTKHQ